jgi:hypothetical protein
MSTETVEAPEQTTEQADPLAATFAEWEANIAARTAPIEELADEDGEQAEGEDQTEQESGDDESAETEAGEEAEEAVEQTATETLADGPTFLMKQEAARAGLDQKFIALAKDDAQLEQMILAATESRDATDQTEDPLPEFSLAVELPEDEYPADDPVRKQLDKMAAAITERQKLVERVLGGLAQEATQRMDREQSEKNEQVFSVFDEYLDSFNSPELGKGRNEARKAIAETYLALGVTPETPAEEKRLLAELALMRHKRPLVEQRTKHKQAAQTQSKRVTGGKSTAPIKGKPTYEQALREWDEVLEGRKPLE